MTKTDQNILDDWVGGDDKDIVVPIVNEAGDVIDTTGSTATYGMARVKGATPAFTLTSGAGEIEIATPTTEKVTIHVAAANTLSLSGLYHHELELVDGLGKVYTAFIGKVFIHNDTV